MSYGCFDREPFKPMQLLYGHSSQTGEPITTVVPFRMALNCQYTLEDKYADTGCVGCKHRKEKQES